MKRVTAAIDKILAPLLTALMAGMVVAVTWQVLSRYIFKAPSSYTEEIARFMLIWIGLLGAAYAYRVKMHLGLDLLVNKLTGTNRRIAALAATACVAGFAVTVLIIGGVQLVQLTWQLEQTTAAMGVPVAYVYTCIPLSGLFITLYALDAALDEWSAPAAGEGL